MTEIQLGKLIEGAALRDAVHIAVVPLIAGKDLWKGDVVKLSSIDKEIALDATYSRDDAIGIVDPFLNNHHVPQGSKFWCYLFPNSVTGMRHHWQHPILDRPPMALSGDSEKWLCGFAERWNFDYDEMISAGIGANTDWRYVTARGYDLHSAEELGEDHDLFWSHLEAMTGMTFDEAHREGMGWSCSC